MKDELQTMKQDNQRILYLNEYLVDRMNNQEKYRRSSIKNDSETTTYKHKGKRENYSNSETSSEVKPRSHRERQIHISDYSESDRKPRRKKYKPYEDISGEFKKIKPPMFNGEAEKGEEEKDCFPGMKKYFQIYLTILID